MSKEIDTKAHATEAAPPPLILTLRLDEHSFTLLDSLRRAHFPPERNFLPAHVTLFHALPGAEQHSIEQTLRDACAHTPTFPLRFPRVHFMGRGVAVEIEGEALSSLRGRLVAEWGAWLGAQDKQKFRPHVTVQNKVGPEEARKLYDELTAEWREFEGRGEGLLLWRYLGGPWQLVGEFKFFGDEAVG